MQTLHEGAQRFFGQIDSAEPVDNAPHLLRVTAGGIQYVVRLWDEKTSVERAHLTSRALKMAADASLEHLPVPQSLPGDKVVWAVEIGGRLVSASTWLPGRPLARYGGYRTPDGDVIDVPLPPSAPAESILLEAVRTIGRFHTASASLAERSTLGSGTLARLLKETQKTWTEQRRIVGDRAANSPEIRRWLRCGNRILPVATEHFEQFGASGAASTVIHGDIWPANILIEGTAASRTLTGVVGWSSVTIGSPLIDLAHLAIHTSGWSGALAENILGAYTEVATLSPGERRLLPVVAAVDLVPRVGALLHLAYIDDEMIGHESQPIMRSGLKSLLTSLENLTGVLAPDAEWDQRKFGENRKARAETAVRKPGGEGPKPVRRPGSGRSRPVPRRGKPKAG